ncbi:Rz-like spanin [Escherichia phage vB_EcoS_NBD2]|uniref:Uncharacterized protein n=1 Tax=Escherichia phage vB_EcoS_NBD2 TaxID=1852563 RepID=A0A192Y8H9_9CAUD|nr:Rz-like spanin [Escherichia phage vB_EcoS_NBD2]ANM45913.1 hypothetical protein NBD2_71 [Escherichia phage vB_EcoS_NBD2]
MKRLYKLIKWIFIGLSAIVICGCSATSALTGLIGSKPEISAQAGAENTKQTVGINGKVDQSSEVETTIKDSTVGKVDTSNGKKTSASSITADTIKADKIEIRNQEGGDVAGWIALSGVVGLFILLGASALRKRRYEKGA